MEKVIHRAATRGYFDHGWLQTFHTFSFADYYNPQRIHFGALRVLNDDTVAGGEGFGSHPHDNMEIVSIPCRASCATKTAWATAKCCDRAKYR
ncbi:MAG: pirin family protein [Alistipes shahii]